MNHWRLLLSGLRSGAYNMALDEALLDTCVAAVAAGESPLPIVRFYGWQPGCLSLGYTQDARRVIDFTALAEVGYDWVRRPTGGRAVLHTTELTYSVVAPIADSTVGGSVLEAYRKISLVLVAGLTNLGVVAHLAPVYARAVLRDDAGTATAACFDAPSAYEVVAGTDERKLIGSAQVRRSGCLLQQGSILLDVDVDLLFRLITPPPRFDRTQAAAQVSAHLTAINPERAAAGLPSVAFAPAVAAFVAAFAAHFDVALDEAAPTEAEVAHADVLERDKYRSSEWSYSRQRPAPARQ